MKVLTTLLEVIGYIALTVEHWDMNDVGNSGRASPRNGLRMAVGARASDIRRMFLIEAVVLSLLGGVLGTLGGLLITYIVCYIQHWSFSLQFFPLLVGFSVSFVVGLFFGVYPAHRAAKLDPIACLRYT